MIIKLLINFFNYGFKIDSLIIISSTLFFSVYFLTLYFFIYLKIKILFQIFVPYRLPLYQKNPFFLRTSYTHFITIIVYFFI
jgi:hypothetical protein